MKLPSRGESSAPTSATVRTVALRVFLVSIAANATLGIWALLTDEFGPTETKVLVTSLLVSAAMLSVLVNGAPLQRRVIWPVPAVAVASAVGSVALFIVLLWAEIDDEVPVKLAVSGLVVAAAATLVGLMAILPLRPDHELVRWLHLGLVALLATTVIWGIWAEIGSSWYGRTVGVESVLVAALTVAIPVLWKFGAQEVDRLPSVDGPPGGIGGPVPTSVGHLASVRPLAIEPDASVETLVDRFAAVDTSYAVVEKGGGVVGVVTGDDVLRVVQQGAELAEVNVVDVMTATPVTLTSGATIAEAARVLVDHRLGHVLVVGDQPAVVSVHDVLAALTASPADPRTTSRS